MKRMLKFLLAVGFIILFSLAVFFTDRVVQPWYRTWGVNRAEIALSLPGDRAGDRPYNWAMRGVTIYAPIEKVWPWLAQIGQDRAGFYSYSWLENLIFADIHNTSQIKREWQEVRLGGFIHPLPQNYLGGILGRKVEGGWRLTHLEVGRMMVLEGWGPFVLSPLESDKTRFFIRSSGDRMSLPQRITSFLFLNPGHFIMERRMMVEIKRLAEGRAGTPPWWQWLAHIGFALSALIGAWVIIRRRGKRLWLLLPLAHAGVVLIFTRDWQSALVACSALSLLIAGLLLFRRWWWAYIGCMWIFTYAVFFIAPDAYPAFGVFFLVAFAFMLVFPPLRRRWNAYGGPAGG